MDPMYDKQPALFPMHLNVPSILNKINQCNTRYSSNDSLLFLKLSIIIINLRKILPLLCSCFFSLFAQRFIAKELLRYSLKYHKIKNLNTKRNVSYNCIIEKQKLLTRSLDFSLKIACTRSDHLFTAISKAGM